MSKPIYLYITPFFPSPESWRGGYCLDAVKAIIRDGRYDVRVIACGPGHDYEWDGVLVYRLKRVIAPFGLFPFLLDYLNNHFLKRLLDRIGVSGEDVGVCHANTLGFAHYAAFFKRISPHAKTIVQFHSSYSITLRSGRLGVIPIHATVLYFYLRRMVEHVDVLAFVSEMARNTFGKCFVGEPEGEIRDVRSQLTFGRFMRDLRLPQQIVVYNGVDTRLFNASGRAPHEGFVIGCVANFQPLKDHMTLLKAVNILKDRIGGLKVRLIGSGQTLQMCRDYVAAHSLSNVVSFEREVDHRDLPGFYRSLDLFVLPSRLEGFVCVCVECAACGTPAIFSSSISLSELISEEEVKYWLFRPCDVQDLVEKVLAYKRGRWAQHFTRSLEINKIWGEFLDVIQY